MAHLKLTWEEFCEAALITVATRYAPSAGKWKLDAEFRQENGYEPDSPCYNFPPKYVLIEMKVPE